MNAAPPSASLLSRSEFVGLEGVTHLCTGGEAPWLTSHDDACRHFGQLKSAGIVGRDAIFDVYTRAKQRVAALLDTTPDRIAFLAHASEGLNQAISAVDWRPGDNAVVPDLEFPSLVFPLSRLRHAGVEIRLVRARDHYVSIDDIAAVDRRTRLLLVSHVSYLTGQRLDLPRCAEIARAHGAFLAVDATHALGIAPVDAALCDFLVSACYKWLLATHGVGIFAYNPDRVGEVTPNTLGWHSVDHRGGAADPLRIELRDDASRFEAGNPSLLSLFVLDNALRELSRFSAAAVLAHAVTLGDTLTAGLRAGGRTLITPADPTQRAGNVCFLADDAPDLATRLAERHVLVWGGEGRLRVSAHLYNDATDIADFFTALDEVR
ncbi:MAG: aminotransferase class V-fold PLP-dependent enzyme [Chloroflexota bacterium]|nr:aminotransferase class V-fold PLP-dependent enzyme [Chloroflexota bacterium]